jgi:hypothetical protein
MLRNLNIPLPIVIVFMILATMCLAIASADVPATPAKPAAEAPPCEDGKCPNCQRLLSELQQLRTELVKARAERVQDRADRLAQRYKDLTEPERPENKTVKADCANGKCETGSAPGRRFGFGFFGRR